MIDFQNSSIFKLSAADIGEAEALVRPMLIENEKILAAFQGIRDFVIFTDKRIISVNVQGITGKKKDFTSLPYSKIQAFSVETAGTFDLDCELDLFFTGIGKVRFEFVNGFDIVSFNKMISEYVLSK